MHTFFIALIIFVKIKKLKNKKSWNTPKQYRVMCLKGETYMLLRSVIEIHLLVINTQKLKAIQLLMEENY